MVKLYVSVLQTILTQQAAAYTSLSDILVFDDGTQLTGTFGKIQYISDIAHRKSETQHHSAVDIGKDTMSLPDVLSEIIEWITQR